MISSVSSSKNDYRTATERTSTIALLPWFGSQGFFGFDDQTFAPLRGQPLLVHTLNRLQQCQHLTRLVLVTDQTTSTDSLAELISQEVISDQRLPVDLFIAESPMIDSTYAYRQAARQWALSSWRGGLGSAPCYDELLCAAPMLEALQAYQATSALLVGTDWLWVDPSLCDAVIEQHQSLSDQLTFVFSQAPPGLAGCLLADSLLSRIAENQSTLSSLLTYHPQHPQADLIGKDNCTPIDASVRNCLGRFIPDTPRWADHLEDINQALPADQPLATIPSATLIEAMTRQLAKPTDRPPQQLTLDLTTDRQATGPITPQHYLTLDRPSISVDQWIEKLTPLCTKGDTLITLGGLGDPLCYPHVFELIDRLKAIGVWGICLKTDLILSPDQCAELLNHPIDVIAIQLNADTPATYQQLMGIDAFDQVRTNIEWLINHRTDQVPWLVPQLLKTADNLCELESFFDRWSYFCRHAVIDSPSTGCELIPNQALVQMAPPTRSGCRQWGQRLTFLPDGTLAQCDQDWLGRGLPIEVTGSWKTVAQWRQTNTASYPTDLCATCDRWYQP